MKITVVEIEVSRFSEEYYKVVSVACAIKLLNAMMDVVTNDRYTISNGSDETFVTYIEPNVGKVDIWVKNTNIVITTVGMQVKELLIVPVIKEYAERCYKTKPCTRIEHLNSKYPVCDKPHTIMPVWLSQYLSRV